MVRKLCRVQVDTARTRAVCCSRGRVMKLGNHGRTATGHKRWCGEVGAHRARYHLVTFFPVSVLTWTEYEIGSKHSRKEAA